LNIQFQYPQALYLLGIIPLLILFFISYKVWKKRSIAKIGEKHLVQQLVKNHSPRKQTAKFIFICLAFALGCVALANPRKPDQSSDEARSGIDVMFALDVSNSMLATDVQPTRLEKAKQLMLTLVSKMPGNRIGLVVFAGKSYLQMPLTLDQNAAQLFIASANTTAVPMQGTLMADALDRCNKGFDEDNPRFKTVILISDGETHDEGAIDKAKELAGRGVMINTVGVGSPQGSAIIDSVTHRPKTDQSGQVVVSKLNEQTLQQVAQSATGAYFHLDDVTQTANGLLQQYVGIEKKPLADISLMNFQTFYIWLAAPMLLFLLLDVFFSDRKRVKE
jgi:Ca-activated chloride channel family protein